MIPTAHYVRFLKDARTLEGAATTEFIVRIALIATGLAVTTYFISLDVLPYWMAAYFALVVLEKGVASGWANLTPYYRFWALLVISFGMSATFAGLAVFVWYQEGLAWQFGALLIMVGHVLNLFLVRARHWAIAVASTVPVVAALFAMSLRFLSEGFAPSDFAIAFVLTCCATVYVGIGVRAANKHHQRLMAAQDRFMQAQRSEALGALASGVAHDFNNLLSVILGNLELLKAYPNASDREAFLNDAIAATQRGADLSSQLLSCARPSEADLVRLAPDKVLHDVAGMARRVLPETISLNISIQSPGAPVLADEAMFQSALLNLVINARDAMPRGGDLTLRMEPTTTTDGLPGVAVEVEDTGEGIPPALLGEVTDPFFSTKPKGKGSGLGLAMVSGFARQAGGDLDIFSRKGQGTRVRIELPTEVP